MNTVSDLLHIAFTNPRKFYDKDFLRGEVYVVTILDDEVRIQANYDGVLVRELPDELIQSAQVSLATGYTTMSAKFGLYTLTVTLT